MSLKKCVQGARRIITLWGHPASPNDHLDSGLSQYSYRLWSGLVRDFYRPRWDTFITSVVKVVFVFPSVTFSVIRQSLFM